MDRPDSVGRLRTAVSNFAKEWLPGADRWCVALSGGPDSLALTAAAASLLPTTALIVDHGLQDGSAAVAQRARDQAIALGCVEAQVLSVEVGGDGGPEAAARTARYAALAQARDGAPVLIGHTLDDQAETVLLGLGRGSGPRSIAGIRPYDPPWCRPLLGVRREVTEAACDALGLQAWRDPHNNDARYTRSRLRHEVLPLLEDVLGGGVAQALARTATALQEDGDVLDELTTRAAALVVTEEGLDAVKLARLPAAVRLRAIREWLLAGGARNLTSRHIRGVDALVTAWRGQGGVAIATEFTDRRVFAERRDGRLVLRHTPR
ncbi:tRNA lysidine(34) synthetase TilS [Mycolicibacterium confluentis]|uniref:tRNA(Ile)-lysidine synthase n=1 Tax=Mycolicibacterium confluentis TaxID=28047 RepID=A0A7I7XQC6_9MYCO|nr:tRNA lysidine(34) synthetase TilS [Mycolicibacterium confluentis]MCV7322388.1 tRNA lysidine(34) synthetase TilS [Mycolicibacterium confluentis]ORV28564.1 tRNA(Ile)-lysidine synthetase [Mycolicibacterium confluentis]BBZ31436.1 tRNA(Ile)-lysidine synthase [Mycolicibacterium confluentis]